MLSSSRDSGHAEPCPGCGPYRRSAPDIPVLTYDSWPVSSLVWKATQRPAPIGVLIPPPRQLSIANFPIASLGVTAPFNPTFTRPALEEAPATTFLSASPSRGSRKRLLALL